MPLRDVWVADIRFSDRVIEKIKTKHGVHPDQVKDACLFGRYERAWEERDPERGVRLVVHGRDRDGKLVRVLLKPVDRADGIYRCITARMVT